MATLTKCLEPRTQCLTWTSFTEAGVPLSVVANNQQQSKRRYLQHTQPRALLCAHDYRLGGERGHSGCKHSVNVATLRHTNRTEAHYSSVDGSQLPSVFTEWDSSTLWSTPELQTSLQGQSGRWQAGFEFNCGQTIPLNERLTMREGRKIFRYHEMQWEMQVGKNESDKLI